MHRKLTALFLFSLLLQGCVVGTAVSLTGDVVEGAVDASVFTVKTTGKAAGAVLPGGDDKDDDEDK